MEARALYFEFLRKNLYGQDLFQYLLLMFMFIRRVLCYKQLSYISIATCSRIFKILEMCFILNLMSHKDKYD
jgi:hypothetical protein